MKRLAIVLSLVWAVPLFAQPVYLKGNPTPVQGGPLTSTPERPKEMQPISVVRGGKSRWTDGPAMASAYVSPPVYVKPTPGVVVDALPVTSSNPPQRDDPSAVVVSHPAKPEVIHLSVSTDSAPPSSNPSEPTPPPEVTEPTSFVGHQSTNEAPIVLVMSQVESDELVKLRANAAKEFYWSQMRAHRQARSATILFNPPVGTGK